MLKRTDAGGVVFYRSELLDNLGVHHAFSTRIGGISPKPFDSLNLGNPNGCDIQDSYDRIWQNYARLLQTIDAPDIPPIRIHQVHGDCVAQVEVGKPFDMDFKGDAIVSRDPQRVISVRTADCLPVLLASDDGKIVSAIHAGWRGIVAGVISAAIRRMQSLDSSLAPHRIFAATGPCIGPNALEVGPEVLREFHRVFPDDPPIRHNGQPDGKGWVELSTAARRQLQASGLLAMNIDWTDQCTVTNRTEFFSHRRDKGITGRMAAVIIPVS